MALLLGVTYKNVTFPLLRLLPKRGNSDTAERIGVIERFIRLFGRDCIDCLVADREFVGQQWTGREARRTRGRIDSSPYGIRWTQGIDMAHLLGKTTVGMQC